MKVEFKISTNRAGSEIVERFDIGELLGCSDGEVKQLQLNGELDDLLHEEWLDWKATVSDGGWAIDD